MTWTQFGFFEPPIEWQPVGFTSVLGGPVLIKVVNTFDTYPDCRLLLRQRFLDGVFGVRYVWPSVAPQLLRFEVPPELQGTIGGINWELEARLGRIKRAPESFSWQVNLLLNYGVQ